MQPARRSSLIASGDCVVFDENGERASFMKVVPVGKLRVGKMQAYYSKGPERVHNLRPDSLAMMLSLGNVAAGSK
ncbi:uncharacterized protein HaLaN_07714, partial [Haematococcus lacustris]